MRKIRFENGLTLIVCINVAVVVYFLVTIPLLNGSNSKYLSRNLQLILAGATLGSIGWLLFAALRQIRLHLKTAMWLSLVASLAPLFWRMGTPGFNLHNILGALIGFYAAFGLVLILYLNLRRPSRREFA